MPVPADWVTSVYDHTFRIAKLGIFKRAHLCTCGAYARSWKAIWAIHVRREMETRQWIQDIENKKNASLRQKFQDRERNLQKYEEFKASLQQNSSPGSANFYQ
jgi:hypothetical protein